MVNPSQQSQSGKVCLQRVGGVLKRPVWHRHRPSCLFNVRFDFLYPEPIMLLIAFVLCSFHDRHTRVWSRNKNNSILLFYFIPSLVCSVVCM